jgi:hypothetical protein
VDFQQSLISSDENSRAYRAAMRGEFPTSVSPKSHTHVAFRLLFMRFVDLISSMNIMDKGKGRDDELVSDKRKGKVVECVSGLKHIVSKVSLSLQMNC